MNSTYDESENERKRQRRLDANRRSAQKSRYRKLVMLNELQKSVSEMTSANATLKGENDVLRDQLSTLLDLYNRGEPYSEELLEKIMNSSSSPSKDEDVEHPTTKDSDEDDYNDNDDNETVLKEPPSPVEKRKSKDVETTETNSPVTSSPILSSQQSHQPLLSGVGGGDVSQNIHLANGLTLQTQQAIMHPPHPPEVLFNGGFPHHASLNQPPTYSQLALYMTPPTNLPPPNLVVPNHQGRDFHHAMARAGMVGGVGPNIHAPPVAAALSMPASVVAAAARQQQQQRRQNHRVQQYVQADLVTSNPFDANAFRRLNNDG